MKVCRYCLQTGGMLCEVENTGAQNFINEIFVQNGYQDLISDNYICCMCKFLLNKSYKFIRKTLRAQQALKEILENNNDITEESLKHINRKKLDLDNNLVCHETSVNYYLWDENSCNQNNNNTSSCSLEVAEDMCLTKRELEHGSETILTPLEYLPEVVYSNENQFKKLDIVKQEKTHKYEIKIDVQEFDKNSPTNPYAEVKIETEYDQEPFDSNCDDDDNDRKKICTRRRLDRKCKIKKGDKNKKKKPPKQKRIKKEIVHRIYPMKCDDCDHMVQSKTEHFHHYLSFHKDLKYPYRREGNYVCQHCGIVKTTAFHLSQHELTHGERNVECVQCGKRFHNLVRLQRHSRRHEAVPRYRCHFCGKGFYAREDIQLHIRTHTGEKPFQCPVCPARFAHRGNVAVHVRNVHQRGATLAPHPQHSQHSQHSHAVPVED